MAANPLRKLRQIVVMGGGGFGMEPRNPRLDRYVLSLTKKGSPHVCFVATASRDSQDFIRRFHLAFEKHPCRHSDLPLFVRDGRDPGKFLMEQDVIYVGGGNTANLLAVWRVHGIDKVMRRAWEKGIILCGLSAGMICWFESSVTDSFGPLQRLDDGLGLLPGSACPHYDGDARRRPTFQRLIGERKLPAGMAADDGGAIHFIGRKIHRCVASRVNARAYRVGMRDGHVVEKALPTMLLSRDGIVG
jgi:peptidase E